LTQSRAPVIRVSVGRLVGEGLATFGRCFVPFVLLTALALSPWLLLRSTPGWRRAFDPWWAALADLGLHWSLAAVATGTLTFSVVRRLQGEPARTAQVIAHGLRSFPRVLGTAALRILLIALASLLLLVPGILLAVRWFVAVPVAAIEGSSGAAAMVRSHELTAGSRGAIFGAWLLVKVVQIGTIVLLQFLLFSLVPRGERGFYRTMGLYQWLDAATTIVVDAFAATLAAVCYVQLRRCKENLEPTRIAAVFE